MEQFLKQTSNNNKDRVGQYTFKFGKHKDEMFEQVYASDKGYVRWCLETLTEEKNSVLLGYLRGRIEEDYGGEQPKKKKQKKETPVKEVKA